ncbi:MAG TPA: hypothetical protein V6D06_21140 [Trichocoleus sp.]
MSSALNDVAVCYRLTPQDHGVKLEIWELPPGSSPSDLTFLFRLQYSLPSPAAAHVMLEKHLMENGYSESQIKQVAELGEVQGSPSWDDTGWEAQPIKSR